MNNKEVSEGRDKRAVIAQAVMAYYSLLLNRGKGDDKRGWRTYCP